MAVHLKPAELPPYGKVEEIDAAVIRIAGDISDGIYGIGVQFTAASTALGNHVWTLLDPAAEIRAPAGALAGVSAFQVHFSKAPIHTPGDRLGALLAMNPAALRAHLADLEPGGILIANSDAFTPSDLELAGYRANPLEDGSLAGYRLFAVPMNRLNREAVARVNLSPREAERARNFFALGLACWLYQRPLEPILHWVQETYTRNPPMIEANTRTLKAGFFYHETISAMPIRGVGKAEFPAGRYRQLNGIDALALGTLTAARQAKLPLVFAGFPSPPAAELLQRLVEWKQPDAKIIQAEDELAAVNLALGAAFGGALAVTATHGPGLALQSESLGLAVMSELPLVVIDLQRPGPAAGMPGKVEQADLLQAVFGRHGECPLIVLAMAHPADGFDIMLEAARLAVMAMSPVIVLADAYLTQSAQSWRVPALDQLPTIDVRRPPQATDFTPYQRDGRLARPWAAPGTPGLTHRVGGLEKEIDTGNVSYEPADHEKMVRLRSEKIARIAEIIPPLSVDGPADGDLLVLGWGSTAGAIRTAAQRCRRDGLPVANAHLRHVHPLPANLAAVLGRYRKVLVPELNAGQLAQLLRAAFPGEIVSLCKVRGQPFQVNEIEVKIREVIARPVDAAS